MGDHQGPNNWRPIDFEHVRRGVVDLRGQGKVRRGWHHIDHARLNGRQDVCGLQRHWGVTQTFHDFLLVGLSAPCKEFHFFVVIRPSGWFFGKKPNPTGVAPRQNNKAFVGKFFLHGGAHFFAHVVDFFPGFKQQGHGLQSGHAGFNFAQAHHRQQGALQLANAHAPRHFSFTALAAIGEDTKFRCALLAFFPDLTQLENLPMVQRIFGHQTANAQLLFCAPSRRLKHRQAQCQSP